MVLLLILAALAGLAGQPASASAAEEVTKATGIQIKMLNGDAGQIFERLKAEGDKKSIPPIRGPT